MGFNGVVPAKYTTDNVALQKIIENSPEFKNGRIFMVNSERITPAPADSSAADNSPAKDKSEKNGKGRTL